MTLALRKTKTLRSKPGESRADKLARAMGGKRFKMEKAVVDSDFSVQELEDFLKWREEKRHSDLEAERNWQL